MEINFDKIEEIYGKETLQDIRVNIKRVSNNINYLSLKNLESIDDIFERYTLLFLIEEKDFKNKVDYLFNKYGFQIDANLELWEEIL